VLSACDLAVSTLHPGDELLGFATALLGMGTRTIVASVVPVPDAAGRRVMLAFHEGLAAGHRPAAALATAQKEAAVAGFVCLGAG
jgi:CHAT domain-containing protein